VIVVDRQRTATTEEADLFVKIEEDREFETLWVLRALVRGIALDADRVRVGKGNECGLEDLRRLASSLQAACYGAFFHGPVRSRGTTTEASSTLEAMYGLVRDLNRRTRFVILGMGDPGNAPGAEAVLTWQTGFPTSVDLGAGYPRSLPGVTSAWERLGRRETDLALIIGEFAIDSLDPPEQQHLESLPRIVIAPPDLAEARPSGASVLMCAATPGLEEAGTIMRVDGVSLPLRPIRSSQFPTERQWVEELSQEIASLGSP
jgi:formylmethanofuran dehydrogenase subunit B